MPSQDPTKRPTDATYLDERDFEPPRRLLNLPWIDVHNHAHTLSWADRERYALAGCTAMVVVASGHHWTPYKPVRPDDVRFLWDSAIDRLAAIERNHFFEPALAVGVQTGVRVEAAEELVATLEDYCSFESVVAVGETGVRPSQQVDAWPLEDQRAIVAAQMAVADRNDLPVLLHTPSRLQSPERAYRPEFERPGYETNASLGCDPVIESGEATLDAVHHDIAAARDVGLAEDRVVASHATPDIVPYLMAETDAYVSFTIGHPWLNGVAAETVANAVDEYGPARIMLDTDAANVLETDVLAIKRAILDLYRFGIDPDAIRQIVFENPRSVFDIGEA